jgi:HEAT repeat protein
MLFSLLFCFLQAKAAIPQTVSAIELLSLPEANRLEIAKQHPKDLYPDLIQMAFAEDRSVPTRWKALVLAAQINVEGSTSDVDRALKSSQWFMRNAALVALKSSQPEKAQKAAVQLLNDKALVVRSAAVQTIDDKPEESAREALWTGLNADYNFRGGQGLWVRREILEKLALNPERQEYREFADTLKDKDASLHTASITALEKLTKKHFGNSKSSLAQKQKLWANYLKKNPSLKF